MANFVLVHGAWHGAWCWRRVVDLLQAQIVQVHQTTHDVLRSLAGALHVKTHQVFETHIDIRLVQNPAVDFQHLGRRKSLFGGDAAVGTLR